MSAAAVHHTEEESAFASGLNYHHPEVLVTPMNIPGPGLEVVEVCGVVFGLTVRSRNVVKNIGADLKSLVGGRLGAIANNLEDARKVAIDRLVGHAMEKHCNAVISLCFDVDTGGASGEQINVCAYGTACKVRPIAAA